MFQSQVAEVIISVSFIISSVIDDFLFVECSFLKEKAIEFDLKRPLSEKSILPSEKILLPETVLLFHLQLKAPLSSLTIGYVTSLTLISAPVSRGCPALAGYIYYRRDKRAGRWS